ncbi:MAG: D-alanyl-D-alanine carboxypeptidase, partial [Litorimonas sp.]
PLLGRLTGADGVKTGSTSVSGYGLVGSAQRDGTRRTIVINGLESQGDRRRVAVELMETAFRDFDVVEMYANGASLGEIEVYMGTTDVVPVILREDVITAVRRVDRDTLSARIDYTVAPAPVEEGAELAELVILDNGEETARYPLYAGEAVARKGFFGRVGASALQKIRG